LILLTSDEKERIARAVKEAEKSTGGEIVTAVIPESDDYAFRELLFGITGGLLVFVILLLFISPFETLIDRLFWSDAPVLLPAALASVSLLSGALFYFLFQIPVLDRLIIGRRSMAEAVKHRALRYFTESNVFDTLDRTGVLLFISILERRVELVADKGINAKVAPDTWDRIVSSLVRGIGRKETGDAIVTAVREIGEVLAEHVPPRKDDENELSDGPVELEKGS
jgi:putative membrane protein